MKPDDARKLDHTTLEEMRIRAVRSVQAGESPEVVARSLRINRRTLAGAVSARWLGSAESQAAFGQAWIGCASTRGAWLRRKLCNSLR